MDQINLFEESKKNISDEPLDLSDKLSENKPENNIKKSYEPVDTLDHFIGCVAKYSIRNKVVVNIDSKQESSDAIQTYYSFKYSFLKVDPDKPSNTNYQNFISFIGSDVPFDHGESVSDYVIRELLSIAKNVGKKKEEFELKGNSIIIHPFIDKK